MLASFFVFVSCLALACCLAIDYNLTGNTLPDFNGTLFNILNNYSNITNNTIWSNFSNWTNFTEVLEPVVSEWRTDEVSFAFSDVRGIRPWNISLVAQANGEFFVEKVGHFRIVFEVETEAAGWLAGASECVELGSSAAQVQSALEGVVLTDSAGEAYLLRSIISVNVKKFGNGKMESSYRATFDIILDSSVALSVSAGLELAGCSPLRTVGRWDDPTNWIDGMVPNETSHVFFPANSGVAVLTADVTLRKLDMWGGYFIAQTSGCKDGWSPFMTGSEGYKCFKLYNDEMSFEDSILKCKNSKLGALDSQLAQIESYEERSAVLHICRSDRDGLPFRAGCWIGLRDRYGTGLYQWIETESMNDVSFRDWRRTEELNRDLSEGFLDNGKRCVHTFPWQEDPAIEEQGSWSLSACAARRAFVCQHMASTRNIILRVTENAVFDGNAEIFGGTLQLRFAQVFDLKVSHGAKVVVSPAFQDANATETIAGVNILETIVMEDGSMLRLEGPGDYFGIGSVHIGEVEQMGIQSVVEIGPEANLYFYPEAPQRENVTEYNTTYFNVTGLNSTRNFVNDLKQPPPTSEVVSNTTLNMSAVVAARVNSDKGGVYIASGVVLDFQQGGKFSSMSLTVENSLGVVTLGGFAARMSEYDSFDILTRHRGVVIGEYVNSVVLEDVVPRGVYRLAVSVGDKNDVTRCIDYHASAQELRELLVEDSALVRQRGGVTVRRIGDGGGNFRFGYRYRVEVDAPSTYDFYEETLQLNFYCSGIDNCGCAQTKIPLTDQFGQDTCLREGNISRTDPASCVIPADISVLRISQMQFTQTAGDGSLLILGGLHRLPPVSYLDIGVSGGAGTVAADQVMWRGITAVGDGTIILAGTGWYGWDSSVLLYRGPAAEGRGLKRMNSAPPCNMSASFFKLSDESRVLTAGPTTNMTWGRGVWSGGIIGGRATLFITENMTANGAGKALQYAMTLFIMDSATLEWSSGDISMSNGADIIVEGVFIIDTAEPMGYIGQTQIMEEYMTPLYEELFRTVSNVDFNGYFDDSLTSELRTAWYMNPACGEQCVKDSQVYMRGNSQFIARELSRATFVSPLNLLGFSTFELGVGGSLILNAGGDCGNFVTMEVSENSEVRLSGGSFAMQATCTITGDGELAVVNGTHNLCFSINAHITISGGAMVWPESRGAKSSLRFFGGLLIQGTGELRVEPLETTITVDKTVEFKDQCLVQFPMIGIAAQPSLYDTVDAPDISPRGSLTANNIMRFAGGTLRGKADFNVGSVLYLEGGEKRIRSLAKLVNRGHAEWSTGDIITADQGDFVNLGSVQMSNGTHLFNSNMRAEGTIVPVESGGDVFALEFHSWDLDQGNLDFQEYVRLRTEFVSRAPDGWNEDLQN